MPTLPLPPPAARPALRLATATLLIVAAALIALVAAGAFDPRPLGPLAATTHPGPLSLAGRGETSRPQPSPIGALPARRSLRLTAAYTGGEVDSGYGLMLGDGALAVAVSPLGEVAIWTTAGGQHFLLPWQPWPHVRPGGGDNEIWLDIDAAGESAHVTVWINRERLWQGEVAPLSDDVAVWLGSFGGPVTVDFRDLVWYGGP